MDEENFEQRETEQITGVSEYRLFAALSYLGVLVFIPLLMQRGDAYVQFHAKQGLVILLGFVVAGVLSTIISVLGNLLWLLLLIASVLGLIQALQGKKWKIPGIAQLAEKFRI